MATIKLDESLCGENEKRAYGLLSTSIRNMDLAKTLATKSDLRDHTHGIDFLPAVRGFSEGDNYIILKTFKDQSANVRPNRIFTHMLSGDLKQISHFDDLQSIFKVLQVEMNKLATTSSLTIMSHQRINPQTQNGRYNKLINGYVSRNEFSNTIVWIGQSGYQDAIADLWRAISPHERTNLNFGIYFSAENIPSDKINIICVPDAVQSKFNRTGYFIISPNDSHELNGLSELILAGDEKANKQINEFAHAIGIKGFKREEVDALAVGIKTFEEFNNTQDLKKLNTLSHIIARYAPDQQFGKEIKARLVNKIVELIPTATIADLSILRLFKIDSFPGSKKAFSAAAVKWLNQNLFTQLNPKSTDFNEMSAIFSASKNWLSDVLDSQVRLFLAKIDLSKATLIYQWAAVDVNIFSLFEKYIENSSSAEQAFMKELPSMMGLRVKNAILAFAIKQNWMRFHATILKKTVQNVEEALASQLKIDINPNEFLGLEVLLKGIKPQRIIQFTVQNPDNRLINYCGALCHERPSLLANINIVQPGWQLIWYRSIQRGNEIKDGLKNIQSIINSIFDLSISGGVLIPELLSVIADSPFANVLNYSNRGKLWKSVSGDVKNKMLRTTSAKLLEGLSRDPSITVPDDSVLSAFIIKEGISDFLYYNRNKLNSTLPIFLMYAGLPEHMITDYLRNYHDDIGQKDAVKLGKLIYNRNLVFAAEVVYNKATKKNNWRFALGECHDILSVFKRGVIMVSGILKTVRITVDEWFEDMGKLIIEFYPNYNALTTIWKKAGGKEYDLPATGTTQQMWLAVLLKLRHRAYEHVKMNDLVKEINKDYGGNQDFKLLFDIRKEFIKT